MDPCETVACQRLCEALYPPEESYDPSMVQGLTTPQGYLTARDNLGNHVVMLTNLAPTERTLPSCCGMFEQVCRGS